MLSVLSAAAAAAAVFAAVCCVTMQAIGGIVRPGLTAPERQVLLLLLHH
jgi:hypothetical protein